MTTFDGELRAVFGSSRVHRKLAATQRGRERGCPGLTVKHTSNLARERVGGEWFLNEISTWLQLTLADGGIVRVSGHIEHFDVFSHAEKSFGEVAPTLSMASPSPSARGELAQDAAKQSRNASAPCCALQHVVAAALQDLMDETSNNAFVFHQRELFLYLRAAPSGRARPRLAVGLLALRKINAKHACRAAAHFPPRCASSTLFDNAVHSGKTQTGSLALLLGREEGFKNVAYLGFQHPCRSPCR